MLAHRGVVAEDGDGDDGPTVGLGEVSDLVWHWVLSLHQPPILRTMRAKTTVPLAIIRLFHDEEEKTKIRAKTHMASCSDDLPLASSSSSSSSKGPGFLFLDDTQFVGKPDIVDPFARGRVRERENTRKRTTETKTCHNCGAQCKELLFTHGCTVECTLGYFKRRQDEDRYKLVCAQFRRVPAYRLLHDVPEATVFDTSAPDAECKTFVKQNIEKLYARHDARRAVYIQQLKDNDVLPLLRRYIAPRR